MSEKLGKSATKKRLIGAVLVSLIVLVMFFTGPTQAVTVNLKYSDGSTTQVLNASKILNFNASINFNSNERVPIDKLVVYIMNNTNSLTEAQKCYFTLSGNLISGQSAVCSNLRMNSVTISNGSYTKSNLQGFGYGYNGSSYNYVNYSSSYGYGYGYDSVLGIANSINYRFQWTTPILANETTYYFRTGVVLNNSQEFISQNSLLATVLPAFTRYEGLAKINSSNLVFNLSNQGLDMNIRTNGTNSSATLRLNFSKYVFLPGFVNHTVTNQSSLQITVPVYYELNASTNSSSVNASYYYFKIFYNANQINALGIDESSLGVWRWTNDSWVKLNGMSNVTLASGIVVYGAGLNTLDHYVWVNISHLSTYTLSGVKASSSGGSNSGGSNSGGSGGISGGSGSTTPSQPANSTNTTQPAIQIESILSHLGYSGNFSQYVISNAGMYNSSVNVADLTDVAAALKNSAVTNGTNVLDALYNKIKSGDYTAIPSVKQINVFKVVDSSSGKTSYVYEVRLNLDYNSDYKQSVVVDTVPGSVMNYLHEPIVYVEDNNDSMFFKDAKTGQLIIMRQFMAADKGQTNSLVYYFSVPTEVAGLTSVPSLAAGESLFGGNSPVSVPTPAPVGNENATTTPFAPKNNVNKNTVWFVVILVLVIVAALFIIIYFYSKSYQKSKNIEESIEHELKNDEDEINKLLEEEESKSSSKAKKSISRNKSHRKAAHKTKKNPSKK